MVVRFALLAALAVAVILILLSRSGSPPVLAQRGQPEPIRPAAVQLPPPMFSPGYVEALRGVVELEPTDADQLEQQLAKDPLDFQSRLKLLAYYARADRAGRPEDLRKRIQQVLWLIENHPESEILRSFVSQFAHCQLTPADYQRAVALWHTAAEAHPGNAAVLWNAASFFQALDQGLQMDYLEATAAADQQHPFALRPLAHFYALSILEGGPLASRAKAALEASSNVWILDNAAYMLQSQYNTSVQRQLPNRRAAELAERYFLRAKAIDPNLDRSKILRNSTWRQSLTRVRTLPGSSKNGSYAQPKQVKTSGDSPWTPFPSCRKP